MATPRRKYRLADTNHADVDLRLYSKVIIETIENIVPGKNPKVFKEYYSTDETTQSESVKLGRALAKIPELKQYGKTVTTFRLFDGKVYSSEAANQPTKKKNQPKGGRMR
ncbi:MAG: hypothetical protein IJF32_06715 [Oscillospiraceae bacterium]|nr:hypothetical protein [Oscillospiraceae bacterium]MBQ7120604.1 hypothetical protein [Oscillospiraceae bacterium]